MFKLCLVSAFALTLTAAAYPAGAAMTTSASPPARVEGSESTVKLSPPSVGPQSLKLENNELVTPSVGPSPKAVVRGGCIFPFGHITYRLFTGAPQLYRFSAAPTRGFDVVMRVDMPGVHRRVDRFFAGGTESLLVRTFLPSLPTTVTISGYLGSSGCFRLAVTP